VRPAAFVGRAPRQVLEFLEEEVDPVLERFEGLSGEGSELRV